MQTSGIGNQANRDRNIALVNIPYGTNGQSMRPIGLAYLGAFLRQNGIVAAGFDFSNSEQSPDALVEAFQLDRFSVVGISFYNTNAILAYRFAEAIKSKHNAALVIAGGPHASANPEQILDSNPSIDIIVRNEGELALLALLSAPDIWSAVRDIAGCTYRNNGIIVSNADQDRIADLDLLPAPIFDFESDTREKPLQFYDTINDELKPAVAMVTSRSCPYKCSFCSIISIGREWRRASAEKVVADLDDLQTHAKQKYGHVYFLDANFFVSVPRTLEVARRLQQYQPGITFSFSTRVNQLIKAENALSELFSLGLRAVEVGIESASQNALDRLSKDTTVDQNIRAVALLRKHRIQLFLDFIMFDAFSSTADLRQNVDFLELTHLDSYLPWDHLFNHLTPYLGTAIRKEYESKIHLEWHPDTLPEPEILFSDDKIRSVYLEFNKIKPQLRRMAEAIQRLENTTPTDWSAETARRLLNATTIRRTPYLLLKQLVRCAELGQPISFDRCMPSVYGLDRARRPFMELVDHALQ